MEACSSVLLWILCSCVVEATTNPDVSVSTSGVSAIILRQAFMWEMCRGCEFLGRGLTQSSGDQPWCRLCLQGLMCCNFDVIDEHILVRSGSQLGLTDRINAS